MKKRLVEKEKKYRSILVKNELYLELDKACNDLNKRTFSQLFWFFVELNKEYDLKSLNEKEV